MKRRHHFLIALVSCGVCCANANAATFMVDYVFDDYQTPFDTTGLPTHTGATPVSAGLLKASKVQPTSIVVDVLGSGFTKDTTRTTMLTLATADPLADVSAFVNVSPSTGDPPNLNIGADTSSPGLLVMHYDFTTIGGPIDAGTGNSHLMISLFDTDAFGNHTAARIEFADANGNREVRDLETDLLFDLANPGDKLVELTEFGPIDFTKLTEMELTWEAGEGYDGIIAMVATGTFVTTTSTPEPGYALALFGVALFRLSARRRRSK